ncbi:MAG TPA: hypothetical protein VGS19_19095 [Streptosporangiaceae bacterium]|nr:hypothetical protein [Streptosporangiaceae bacterium]
MTRATGGAAEEATAQQPGRFLADLSPVTAVMVVTTLLAFFLRAYVLLRPGLMSITQYDDGPYFGSAVRLVHGVLPYRDFALVQPPGITVLMSPAGLLSYLTGTAWGLVIARVLTVLASTAAVVLAGLLVRHRGVWAVLVTCGILAVYPPSVASSHTVLLEPWLVLFCLAGAVAAFDGDRLTASTRRLAWGGAAFGFAGATKAWAIVPVAIVLALCLPALRRAAVFIGGVAAGFGVPVLPFAIPAPSQFYDAVITAQLARAGARDPVSDRLRSMLAISRGALSPTTVAVIALVVALLLIGAQVAAVLAGQGKPRPLDWFAMVGVALTVVMFLWPPYFAEHYAAFLGPFLALAVGLAVERLAAILRARPHSQTSVPQWLGRAAITAVAVLLVVEAVAEAPGGVRGSRPAAGAAERLIPPGACALTDQASYLLLANRFVSNVAGCPQMVDSLGTDLALSGGRRPGSGAAAVPAVANAWHDAFSHAQYVLLSPKNSLRVPWSPALSRYFHATFRLVHTGSYKVYARTGLPR